VQTTTPTKLSFNLKLERHWTIAINDGFAAAVSFSAGELVCIVEGQMFAWSEVQGLEPPDASVPGPMLPSDVWTLGSKRLTLGEGTVFMVVLAGPDTVFEAKKADGFSSKLPYMKILMGEKMFYTFPSLWSAHTIERP